MKTRLSLLLTLLTPLAALAESGGSPVCRALCVGVNEYDESFVPQDNWLDGCAADAGNLWTNLTERGEWTGETATLLVDAAATKSAVRAAIAAAAAASVPGDVFVYTHSSHGYSRSDETGAMTLDTGICTYDSDYDDCELAADLAQFPAGAKVVVLVDACNSGGLFKARKSGSRARAGEEASSSAPFDLAERVSAAIDAIRAREPVRRGGAPRGICSSEIGWLTAADYNQSSWDYASGGAFTLAVLEGWATGHCDYSPRGDEDGFADFYELWNYAKDVAVGDGNPGSENYTEAQCFNPGVLRSVRAGWVGDLQSRLASPLVLGFADVSATSFEVRLKTPHGAEGCVLGVWDYYDYYYRNPLFYDDVGDSTNVVVTGLRPDRAYSVMACAYAGNRQSAWSPEVFVSTYEVRTAPSWLAVPVPPAQVGRPCRIDLAPYVGGYPAPTLRLESGDATLAGSVLSFTPAATGPLAFTVVASNVVGTASATLEVEAGPFAPKKFALCVGIDKYRYISSLGGCANDARTMAANLAGRGGWDQADIALLVDSAATKSAIRGSVSNFAAQAMAGDVFVYQHSSHGGQFNSGSGEILHGEDGKETFLCVHDESYSDNSTAYNDWEIAADLSAFPSGVKVAVIVDACHSGGLFKGVGETGSAASFDLAARVSAAIDAARARRRARGEPVERTLSASEIGWAVACEFDELSSEGGFYHTDKWLTDVMYGEEHFVFTGENSGYYDFPDSYRNGGLFLSSATWGWWNGSADAVANGGDGDSLCDAYEMWRRGYDFCSKVGEFWYGDPDYNYYAQCTNVAVLRSVELGWTAPPEPLPVLPALATADDVAVRLAGAADSALVENVATPAAYEAFRAWAGTVKDAPGGAPAGAAAVREATRAWLSFALGSDTLLGRDLTSDDVAIKAFAPAAQAGRYELELGVGPVEIGSGGVEEALLLSNLAKILGLEGASSPDPSAFSPSGISGYVSAAENGNAKLVVVPPSGATSFFLRASVSQ